MTKKNKSKRNKIQEDFPSLYMIQDDYPNTFDNGGNLKDTLLGAGMGAIGNVGGNLISGGKSTGFGNTIGSLGNTIGGAAMAVNPIVGGAIMAGSQIVGGITNALFGSKLNNERIAQAENEIGKARSFNANASNFDDLSQQMASQPIIAGFSQSDIGSDGWFANKAKKKYQSLLAQKEQAEDWVNRSIDNSAANLQQNQIGNLLQNYAAFGGPLGYGFDGALGYDLANQQLGINAMKAMGQNKQYSLPNLGLNTFAEGGKIHIKPENRGKFTALKKRTGKSATWFKKHGTPAQRKMATFALNARKWKHAFGGDLITNGGVFSNNVTVVKNGGSHNENPYEGVQLGVDPQGIPNLVEENEVIWNDYVFSDRIKVPKTVKDKQKLRGNKNMTFADAANKIQKMTEERPNDPISMETMNINLTRLAQEQEALRQQKNLGQEGKKKNGKKYDIGGLLSPYYDAPEGTMYDPLSDRSIYVGGLFDNDNTTSINFGAGITPSGEWVEEPKHMARAAAKRAGYNVGSSLEEYNKKPIAIKKSNNNQNNYATWLRYAPVAGSILGLSQTLLSSPDYSRADALAQYAQNTGQFQPITYNPLGNYLTYNPTDINYQANRAAAQAGATRRNIMNTAGGNRANAVGSLLAADYNAQLAQGELLRQAEEANLGRRMQVESFNRGTNQANSEMALKAAMANQEARLKASQMGLSGYTAAMQMKDAIDAQRNASISANLTNLFDSLGDIGREEVARRMVMENPALLYDYYGRYKSNKSAKGGKLNKKKRGGFTY